MAETEIKEPTDLEKELATLNENIAKLEELYKKGEIEEEAYKKLKEEYESKKKELEKRMKKEIAKPTHERIAVSSFVKVDKIKILIVLLIISNIVFLPDLSITIIAFLFLRLIIMILRLTTIILSPATIVLRRTITS